MAEGPASVARAYFAAIGSRDAGAMAELWEQGGVGELHGLAALRAPEDIRGWFGNLFRAVPDLEMEVLDLLAEGDKVAVHWHATGTFSGDVRFEGAIPTGGKIDLTGCDVIVVREGRIRRNDAYLNGMQMARQMGVLPPQGSGQERMVLGAANLRTRVSRALGRSPA